MVVCFEFLFVYSTLEGQTHLLVLPLSLKAYILSANV